MTRIYLSPPHMGVQERDLLLEAFDSNWIAPLGPHVDQFEAELAAQVGVPHAVALSSGTAGLHLSLLLAGVGRGDTVLCSDLTFSATANAVTYCGAEPTFIDCDDATWTMDSALLEEELARGARTGRLPKAAVVVDLYGQCADYGRIEPICRRYGVPLIEDAAEALGASVGAKRAGSFGTSAVVSFNGNKIITTSGGGALLTHDAALAQQARFLATQARDAAPHYEHSTIGYNYRLSNLLAAIGRGQLRVLDERVRARRAIFARYREAFEGFPGVELMPEAPYGTSTRWLTCMTIDETIAGVTREDLRLALDAEDIEARPVWKPMHLQPVFSGCRFVGTGRSADLFRDGICLPSGSSLRPVEQNRIIEIVTGVLIRGRSGVRRGSAGA